MSSTREPPVIAAARAGGLCVSRGEYTVVACARERTSDKGIFIEEALLFFFYEERFVCERASSELKA